jgi:hypothetical protein
MESLGGIDPTTNLLAFLNLKAASLPVYWSGPPTCADIRGLVFVLNNALGRLDSGHRRLPVANLSPSKRLANASASSGLEKQNTTKSLSSLRRE